MYDILTFADRQSQSTKANLISGVLAALPSESRQPARTEKAAHIDSRHGTCAVIAGVNFRCQSLVNYLNYYMLYYCVN